MRSRMFSSIPGLYPLDVALPSCNVKECKKKIKTKDN